MAWRDELREGSWRGVPFYIETSESQLGRRTQVHEFPGRETPFVEDLGRRIRVFTVDMLIIGPNYMRDRDRMLRALEAPGSGLLIHPYYGTMEVALREAPSIRESTREGGLARIHVTFVEAGRLEFPNATTSFVQRVSQVSQDVEALARSDFASVYTSTGQDDFLDETHALLMELFKLPGLLLHTLPVIDLTAPALTIAGLIQDYLESLTENLESDTALTLAASLTQAQPSYIPNATTQRRTTQQRNVAALKDLTQRLSFALRGRLMMTYEYPNADVVKEAVKNWGIDLEKHLYETTPSFALLGALQSLNSVLVEYLINVAASLPLRRLFNLQAVRPALLLAHQLYGDLDRADEIVRRNNVPHPNFVPAGLLEVLSE